MCVDLLSGRKTVNNVRLWIDDTLLDVSAWKRNGDARDRRYRCVAWQGVRSQLVPIAPVGLCSIPVV